MLYIVSEYASQGEIFGKSRSTAGNIILCQSVCYFLTFALLFRFVFCVFDFISHYLNLSQSFNIEDAASNIACIILYRIRLILKMKR